MKLFRLFSLVGLTCLTLTACSKEEVKLENVSANYTYDIYPVVKEVKYNNDKSFKINEGFNIVVSGDVDQVTLDRLTSYLSEYGYTYQVSDKLSKDLTNLSLKLDKTIDAKDERIDNYKLTVENGTIEIIGEDSNSLFYGVNTFGLMLEEVKENDNIISAVMINDYASSAKRGVIEGFYGVPWNFNDRVSIFEFGSVYKMNSYTFAPKDDKYHSTMWRSLYPEAELEEMAKLVKEANQNKIEFTWSIHPLMHDSLLFGETYAKDLEDIENKFLQLYSIGVRKFAVSADDIHVPADADGEFFTKLAKNHAKLLNDLEAWGKTLEEEVTFEIVPTTYFKNSKNSTEYLSTLGKELSKNIDIYYTGDEIMGKVNEKEVSHFDEVAGRAPLFWLNWPVNDYYDPQMFMAEATCLSNDVTSLAGVVSNPLSQAEASKVGIFQVLDFGWNIEGFDSAKSYRASFDAIDKMYGKELYTFASNIQTYAPGAFWVPPITDNESPEFMEILKPVLEMTSNPESFIKMDRSEMRLTIDPVYAELNNVIKAIDTYREAGLNRRLVAEITPWMNSLRDLMFAGVRYMDAINVFIRDTNLPSADSLISRIDKARAQVEVSESSHMISVIDTWGSLYYASTGDRTLKPFFVELHANLENIAKTSLK